MGALRPIRSMSGYKTPVGHLWHTAAGAHPMGALNGWSGRTTGRMVDRIIRRAKDEPAAGYSAYVPPAATAHGANGSQPAEQAVSQ